MTFQSHRLPSPALRTSVVLERLVLERLVERLVVLESWLLESGELLDQTKKSIRSHLRIFDLERPLKPEAVSPFLLARCNSSALGTS
jgi:hypothetical protein